MLMEDAAASTAERDAARAAETIPRPPRFALGRVPVDSVSMEYAAVLITEALLRRGERPPVTIVGPNAHLVNLAERDERFAAAMQSADLSVPDGMSVVWAARLLGAAMPERVAGGDLMEKVCAQAAQYGLRVFFLGGATGAAIMAAWHLRRRYPGLNICGTSCPQPGFEASPAELARIRGEIEQAQPDLVCVAFGAPKQEIWIHENRDQLRVGAILAVGGALDRQAGLWRRAPLWMQRIGMEWSYRLMLEPRRLWRRYLLGNPQFVALVLRQWARSKARRVKKCAKDLAESYKSAVSGD